VDRLPLFTHLPRAGLLGNSRHEKSRGVREPRLSCLLVGLILRIGLLEQ
jgi:hypothetical protein